MKIKIRRIDKSLPLPEYKTEGAVAMDCVVRERTEIAAHKTGFLPLNIALQVPKGFFTLLVARSSLPKHGLMMANSVGIIDEDYSGNDDEFKAFVYNYTDQLVVIERGDRVAQIIILAYERVEWEEVESLENKNRGAFGTTGK
jgi:dUTP pyrophosphatase